MPRRREVPKRDVSARPEVWQRRSVKVCEYVVMQCVRKSVAERIVYGAFDQVEKKSGKEPLAGVQSQALVTSSPVVEVKSRRVGGANYQVPVEVRPSRRRMALAMRWLREAARKRREKSMALRLAAELLDAAEGRGGCDQKTRRSAPHGRSEQSVLALSGSNFSAASNRGLLVKAY
jgi:small subunit ribosomal protein S7